MGSLSPGSRLVKEDEVMARRRVKVTIKRTNGTRTSHAKTKTKMRKLARLAKSSRYVDNYRTPSDQY